MKNYYLLLLIFSMSSIANANNYIDICERGYISDFIAAATQSKDCSEVDREKMEQLRALKIESYVTVRCERPNGIAKECLPLNRNSFAGLKNLKELHIVKTQISGFSKGTFSSLQSLEKLVIKWNDPLKLSRESFEGLSSLKELFIYGSINESEFQRGTFKGLTNLQNMLLSSVFKTAIPPYVFEGLDNLKQLGILNHQLFINRGSATKESFFGLNNLRSLTISSPSLIIYTSRTIDSMVFSELKNLKYLSLKKMRVGDFEDQAFEGLKELESLDLSRNIFKVLSPEIFGNANIRNIDVNYNCQLDTIEDRTFSKMSFLSTLNLMKTRITSNYIRNSIDRIGLKEGTQAYALEGFCL